ncbi:MAG: glycosyltransferase family 2 protein [Acidobacteriota bacterium]
MNRNAHKIGIVVLNYQSASDTLACLQSIRAALAGDSHVWVVDNASGDSSADTLEAALAPGESLLQSDENLGYGGGNNLGIRKALEWGADYVLVLNPDCRLEPDSLSPLIIALEAQKNAGIACPLVLDTQTGLIQAFGGSHSLWTGRARRRYYHREPGKARIDSWRETEYPHGTCMLLKRAFLEDVGLIHEGFFLYYEDVELGLRARSEHWKILVIPQSRVWHADTTASRRKDALTTYHAVRNQAWVERLHAAPLQYTVFLLFSIFLRWPGKFFSRLLTGHFRASWSVVRGAFSGLFSSSHEESRHLVVFLTGRRVNPEETTY